MIVRKFVGTLHLLTCSILAWSQFQIASIPDSLKEGADAVFISNQGEYTIHDAESATYNLKRTVAIMNPEGNKWAYLYFGYDKLRKIGTFKATAFDINGEILRKLKNSDISDQSAISGFSVYEDNRVKLADMRQKQYPYILEYEVEINFKMTYSIPNWYLLPSEEVGVLYSSFTISAPNDFVPRYKVINAEENLTRSSADGISQLHFEHKNLSPISYEPLQPKNVLPAILTAPSKFSFSGYEGSFETWTEVGKWQNMLNKGLNDLSPETMKHISELTSDASDEREKIRRIYEYVQNNTRYVSIQLGIGGFQPFANSVVEKTGYGDCKALSFYTQSLLESVGIDAYYTWVKAGRNEQTDLDNDFPIDQFNHIILCVPTEADTVWLECTSQTNPFGYLGSFTSDRDVVVISDEGGQVVRTPKYPAEQNKMVTKARVNLLEDLSAQIELDQFYRGLQFDWSKIPGIISLDKQDQKKWVFENLKLPNMTVEDFEFNIQKDPIPKSFAQVSFWSGSVFKSIGKRVFFNPNILNRSQYIPEDVEKREYDMIIRYGYVDIDSISFSIPTAFRPEYLPEPFDIETEFGHYKATLEIIDDQLIYRREMMIKEGIYDRSKYPLYREFRSQIVKADKLKIALLNKT